DAVSRYILGPAISCHLGSGLRQADQYPLGKQRPRDTVSLRGNAAAGSARVLHRIALQDSLDPVRKTGGDALRLMNSLLLHNEGKPSARSRWPRADPVQSSGEVQTQPR